MSFVRYVLALAVFLAFAAPRVAPAQQMDPYVSCVRCHALPMQQAQGALDRHGIGYPPTPEAACMNCHDTWYHEQDPGAPAYQPYLWSRPLGPGSVMTGLCLSCHTPYLPGTNHPNDVFPYFDATPLPWPPVAPTSVLPLFDPIGLPNQNPYAGGIVCSTCHNPHDPAYPVNGLPKFLRIGAYNDTLPLCSTCHVETPPGTIGEDLFIDSRSDSVRFQSMPYGELLIEVMVKNRGNNASGVGYEPVFWEDSTGYRMYIGSWSIPPIPPETQALVPFVWMPPPDWTFGEGFFVFSLPASPLRPDAMKEFIRAMDVPPAPMNLRAMGSGPGWIDLMWDPPPGAPGALFFDVYRDGVKVNLAGPVYGWSFSDWGLAPETPHVYSVKAVNEQGIHSAPSNPAGGTTSEGLVVEVPLDYPTIQAAIDNAASGTSIHVAPGTYTEPLWLAWKHGITVKCQDANGCVLDYTATPGTIVDIRSDVYYPMGNTLSGFTIREGQVFMRPPDVLSGCVLQNFSSFPAVRGGGLIAQCTVDSMGPAVELAPAEPLAAVNSYFSSWMPFSPPSPDMPLLLVNNAFFSWYQWSEYEGSGNFMGYPSFEPPGPPGVYLPNPASQTTDRGLALGAPFAGAAPDVGAFEAGWLYTPHPPSGLTATYLAGSPGAIRLTWDHSIDAPSRVWEYLIYRSTDPAFPPGPESAPIASVSGDITDFFDTGFAPETMYYYQVRAFAGPAAPPSTGQLLSGPTNTASAGDFNQVPVVIDDFVVTPEDQFAIIPVLANDTDPNGDALTVAFFAQPVHGTATLNPDGSFTYAPRPDFFGADSFPYTVTDGRGGFATASVSIDVVPVNDLPVAADDAYVVEEDATLIVPAPGVLGNDADVDGVPVDALILALPGNGFVSQGPLGSFTYTPAGDFHGTDSFTYRATDGLGLSNMATVTITVTAVNDAPVALGQSVTTAEDAAVAVTLTGADVDGGALTFAVAVQPLHGTLSGVAPILTYTPNANYNGTDSFTFTASDGTATSAEATVTITVTAVNDDPVANAGPDKSVRVNSNTIFNGSGSGDVDGTIVSYSWNFGDGTSAAGQTVTRRYKKTGTYTVTLTVTDNQGATGTDTAQVTVTR